MVEPNRFQQTDVGVIPEDWEVTTLDKLFVITSSKRVFQSEWRSSGVPFYRARELAILSAKGRVDNELFISRELYDKYTSQYGAIAPHDVLITGVGTLGKVYVVKEGDVFYFKDGNIIWLRSKHKADSNYVRQLYYTSAIISQVFGTSAGTTVGTYTITNAKRTIIPLPKELSEQHVIAEALSDADGYIASLEKLIEKKKTIKQGAMQELLTGKRRLPGFDEEWVETTLGELCVIKDGTHQTPNYVEYGIPFYSVENVTNNNFTSTKYISLQEHTRLTANFRIERGDILMTRIGSIGVCKYVDWDVNASFYVSLALLKCGECVDAKFLSLYSGTEQFQKELELNSLQHAIPKKINLGAIALTKVVLPPSKEEQSALATILSDMDREIETLTAKLDKAKLVKQGMMQELLTGRIRLPQTKSSAVVTVQPEVHVTAIFPSQKGHNQKFDDAVMIAGIVNAFYTEKYPLGRKKVQKLLYLLRRKQDESTVAFKKKAAGPYADEVRYKGGEPIANSNRYIATTTTNGKGTTFTRGKNIRQALNYIDRWGRQSDIQWLADKFRYTSVDDLELLATVDMAICDLEEAGIPVSVASIKHLIATNKEWQAKLQKKIFADSKIAKAISDLQTLL